MAEVASSLHFCVGGRHEHARSWTLPPPRIAEQPQACSTSRSLMAAPVQTALQLQVRALGGKHSPSECQAHTRARTLATPPPRTVEQPQACSISRRLMAAPVQTKFQDCRHEFALCVCLRLANPQACSTSRSLMAALVQTTLQVQVQVRGLGGKQSPSECQRQTPARTSSRPPPCIAEQPQACYI